MSFIKNNIWIAIIGCLTLSCGGDDSGGSTTPPAENSAPTTPVQIYPANNELCINNSVNFQWNASSDPDSNPISYVVEISENNSFSPLTDSKTVSTTSVTISLEKGIAYYWRVKAVDSKNASSSLSSSNGFYTEGEGVTNYIPFAPDVVAPSLGATVKTDTATFQWTSSDVDNDDLTFDVYLGTANPPTTLVSENQSANSFETDPLTSSTTYYWKIVVNDGKGGETIGQVWNFITD